MEPDDIDLQESFKKLSNIINEAYPKQYKIDMESDRPYDGLLDNKVAKHHAIQPTVDPKITCDATNVDLTVCQSLPETTQNSLFSTFPNDRIWYRPDLNIVYIVSNQLGSFQKELIPEETVPVITTIDLDTKTTSVLCKDFVENLFLYGNTIPAYPVDLEILIHLTS